MERLNPLNDYIFKRLMGEEESVDNKTFVKPMPR